ncbi:MAG: P-loop NTPase fold protein, partial [Phycisphaerae bacterium]
MTEAPKSSKASGKKSDQKEAPAKRFSPITAEMLAMLPPEAIAAWAGRCALRVQPLIKADSFAKIPSQQVASHIETLDIAVTLAMVRFPAADYATRVAARAAFHAADATTYTADADNFVPRSAARAATRAADAADAADAVDAANYAETASAYAAEAAARATSATYAAALDDYEHLVQSNYDLETFVARPLWLSGETQGWRDIVNAWGKELDSLASQFPELHGIYERHVRLLEGEGIDFEESRERIDGWLRRYDSDEDSQDGSNEGDNDSFRTEEQSEQSEGSAPQTSETPAPDRRGAPTSTLDAPTTDDSLDRKPLVQSLAAMFAAPQQATPFTLALLGDWGAGKSSVMDQLRKELASGKYGGGAFEFLFATFNAWQYEHTDDIRAGLAQEVVSGLTQGLRFWERWRLTFRFA